MKATSCASASGKCSVNVAGPCRALQSPGALTLALAWRNLLLFLLLRLLLSCAAAAVAANERCHVLGHRAGQAARPAPCHSRKRGLGGSQVSSSIVGSGAACCQHLLGSRWRACLCCWLLAQRCSCEQQHEGHNCKHAASLGRARPHPRVPWHGREAGSSAANRFVKGGRLAESSLVGPRAPGEVPAAMCPLPFGWWVTAAGRLL